ncbi:MAG: hypothetical protein QF463_06040 [Vicinamibacterales bacterium]|jgi:YHS domain-containing protein|nr:hypothetical protein [Acidobacteriota bacterium]MDP6372343.1 hypothetical protein [Vicinamibacterales bacterium]MDP6608610.1 hypothetical protein [Vicinamibacterales bacterium]HAK54388.1 hypothetical protein [Acidobacteriota bacterium]|tara:strand:+ start:805 stop:1050 length:246 start_codon:yes stop_codon:yes gene_type:complete
MWIAWLLRILLIAVAVRAAWRFLGGLLEGARGRPTEPEESVPLVRDPVCGTYVVRARAVVLKQGARTEYFCSEQCRSRFEA